MIGDFRPKPTTPNSISSTPRKPSKELLVKVRNPATGKVEEMSVSNARDMERHHKWQILNLVPVHEQPTNAQQEAAQKEFLANVGTNAAQAAQAVPGVSSAAVQAPAPAPAPASHPHPDAPALAAAPVDEAAHPDKA